MTRRPAPTSIARAALVLAALGASACASDDVPGSGAAGSNLQVVASFYPLAYVVQRVGGDRVTVTNLTPAGAEPHDLELTPHDVAGLSEADLVVYLEGFSPAVDDAVTAEAGDRALEVGQFADLSLTFTPIEEGALAGDGKSIDPHFWLDPARLADVADEIAARLSETDPEGAETFSANAAALRQELEGLDGELECRPGQLRES